MSFTLTSVSTGSRYFRQTFARLAANLMVPTVYRWVRRQEATIRRHGRILNAGEAETARDVGLADPAQVWILAVSEIPLPCGWLLKTIARFSRVALADPVALTAGCGIYLRTDLDGNPVIMRHELVHVRQYVRLGRRVFLKQYLHDCIVYGYEDSPLEKEARRISTIHDDC